MISNSKQMSSDSYISPSFSFKNRVARYFWEICYFLFFRYSPIFSHKWRAFILRCFGAKIGKQSHIYSKVRIWAPWNLIVGDNVGIADNVNLYSQGRIIIGNRVTISQGSYICTGSHDYTLHNHPLITKPIVIEDNVWVAAECFIHPGVTIGEGAVIGARSVIIRDVQKWTVCAGNPCQPIKKRILI
jgi:putative colanic acid biosynthesis acetyltransferase WcaF